ncbi:uncharacterized protein BCR38DRAFT_233388 [Pseudomassariella vexata]|uniref:Uncharacterized protein n=1 Tax=Pseudomassariella vexata TaxID=1141098 RepID=A0A1Y2DU21_9PEZI|nr:uncharacterized protein BCR38DRAFT_233388 [Pseudomassariella vexata]ORY62135.1 hypothetical protein BCR38DRAFT_233388 [Pseudomassariella vexata]
MSNIASVSVSRVFYTALVLVLFSFVRCTSQERLVPREEIMEQHDTPVEPFQLRPIYLGVDPRHQTLSFADTLFKRDCLSNGSNYCFGNSVDYCPNCGTCCVDSGKQVCCADATSTCCGGGCCAAGELCTNGQCASPIVTVTSTTTFTYSITHVATALESVKVRIDEISTVNSVVIVTVSNIATATEVTYTTTTVIARRRIPAEASLVARGEVLEATANPISRFSSLLKRLVGRATVADDDHELASPFAPRFDPVPWTDQPTGDDIVKVARAASTTTIIVSVTSMVDVTNTISSTVTASTTYVSLTTSVRTQTR